MNRICKSIALYLPVLLVGIPAAFADTICWDGSFDSNWEDERNWNDCSENPVNDPPGASDTAIIDENAQRDCQINDNRTVNVLKVESGTQYELKVGNPQHTGSLKVLDHAEIRGGVRIGPSSTLELAGTSTTTLDGSIWFWVDSAFGCSGDPTGTLLISDDSTIQGYGGLIWGQECYVNPGPVKGMIKTAAGKKLTLATYPASTEHPLLVLGSIDIQARLTNASARVGVSLDGEVMILSMEDKDGDDGTWFCHGGEFRVKSGITVSGDNDWDMTTHWDPSLVFESDVDATCLSGDFYIHDGTVELSSDLCTTGSFIMKSVQYHNGEEYVYSDPEVTSYSGNDLSVAGECAGCGS